MTTYFEGLNEGHCFKVVYSLFDFLEREKRNSGREDLFEDEGDDNFKTFGAFGSVRWKKHLMAGEIPTVLVSGVVGRTFFSGQDDHLDDEVNAFNFLMENGCAIKEGMYFNDKEDFFLYKKGARINILYAFDLPEYLHLKNDCNYSDAVVVKVEVLLL